MGYGCEECGREIMIDVLIDTKLWKEISPTRNEGGLLCAACIADEIAKTKSGKKWAALRLISMGV